MLVRAVLVLGAAWEVWGILGFLEAVERMQSLRRRTLRSFPAAPMEEYDFVVVGAGPAGSVVTNRLTEVPGATVLLLEDGPTDNLVSETPGLNVMMILTDYNWDFHTERQEGVCMGLEQETCPWPSGRGAGGGSAMNAMIYTRGNAKDFDDWAAMGNEGWSYREVLPYFMKSERVTIPELKGSPYHGRRGNLTVGYPPYTTPLLPAFLEAGRRLGYNLTDYNSPGGNIGFSRIQATMDQGLRTGASKAYLKPIVGRKNFHLALDTRVTRVLVDPATKTAWGVEYRKNGVTKVVRAKKEVVLSAGSFNTPQLLMLAGIGPEDHLKEMGISVVADLPVGEGLEEHVGMNGLSFLINTQDSIVADRETPRLMSHYVNLLSRGQGPLTTLGCEGIAFVKTKYALDWGDRPDLELLFIATAINNDGGATLRKTMGVSDALYDSVYANISGRDAFSVWPILQYPKSKGYVRLRNRNPLSKVRIYPNFLRDPLDRATLVEGLKLAVEIGESEPFRRFGAKLHRVPFPGCEDLEFGSDPYWECTTRQMTSQFHHQCCTSAMGRVVDSRLRVLGVKALRVADASVMPRIIAGHTQATCYMIGEKAADMIKQDWGLL